MFGRGTILRDVVVLAGGAGLGHVFSVAAMPIASRLYSPSDFGKFELYFAFMNCCVVVSALAYEKAIIAAADKKQAACLTLASLLFSIPVGFLAGVCLYAFIKFSVLGFGNLPASLSLLVPLCLLLTSGFIVLRNWNIREGDFRLVARVPVYQSVLRSLSQITLGFISAGWAGLISSDVLGRAAGVLKMMREAWGTIRHQASLAGVAEFRKYLWDYRKFPLFSLPSALVNMVALMLPLPLIAAYYGVSAAGEVGIALKVFAIPSALIAANVADVFHNRIARYQRENNPEILACFWQTFRGLFLIGLVPSLLILAFGPWLFGSIFGKQWVSAGVLASVMVPWALAELSVSPLSRLVDVFGRQEIKLVYDCIALSLVMIVPAAHFFGASLVQTVALLAVGKVLVYGVYFYLLFYIARTASVEQAGSVHLISPLEQPCSR